MGKFVNWHRMHFLLHRHKYGGSQANVCVEPATLASIEYKMQCQNKVPISNIALAVLLNVAICVVVYQEVIFWRGKKKLISVFWNEFGEKKVCFLQLSI